MGNLIDLDIRPTVHATAKFDESVQVHSRLLLLGFASENSLTPGAAPIAADALAEFMRLMVATALAVQEWLRAGHWSKSALGM
jgi:hypothetical protein